MRKNAENTEKSHNNTVGKRTVFLLLVVIAVAIAFSIPVFQKIEKSVEEEVAEGFVLFNASRYFFRFDYPSNWIPETGANGFYLNKETHLVASLTPAVHSGTDEDGNVEITRFDGVRILFYSFDNDGKLTLGEALKNVEDKLESGLLSDEFNGYQFGSPDSVNVASQRCDLICADLSAAGEEESALSGLVYAASREFAYYGIVVTYENPNDYSLFKPEIDEVIRSFRLSVFKY